MGKLLYQNPLLIFPYREKKKKRKPPIYTIKHLPKYSLFPILLFLSDPDPADQDPVGSPTPKRRADQDHAGLPTPPKRALEAAAMVAPDELAYASLDVEDIVVHHPN